jgi:hypothetical protein
VNTPASAVAELLEDAADHEDQHDGEDDDDDRGRDELE